MSSKKRRRITAGNVTDRQSKTLIMSKPRIFSLDLGDYVEAINQANILEYNKRSKLYDLYTSILLDGHLTAIIEKRKASALSTPIIFTRDGKEDEVINELIEAPWFDELLNNCLDQVYWGFTLMQLYQEREGWINSYLIPRKHVDPVRRLILRQQHDTSGASWDEFDDLLFVGSDRGLGLLAIAAPYALYKRNSLADWAQFSEIFGMPLREYTYDGNDPNARDKILQDIYEQGSLAIVIHPEGSNMNFLDSPNKTGSIDVYDKMIVRCNKEMSKLVLGNTLSTEEGDNGTQALATVQREGEDYIRAQDRKRLLNILNYELTDYFLRFGIDTRGGKFVYKKEDKLTPNEFLDMAIKMVGLGFKIDEDQIYERTGFRKPPKGQDEPKKESKESPKVEDKEPKQEKDIYDLSFRVINSIRDFFLNAPEKSIGGKKK